ncbi:A disintegrin and metalloproteinase with thrombospondin motifs 7-like [Iris pallida]|nr:A disintegrin and metalloproteinase with thrombospondin motifs 7-like [Iris pallida]
MKCSSPCDGGVRYRDVGCYGNTEDASIKHYPADPSRCSGEEMPARQEPCNLKSCVDLSISDMDDSKKSGMSGWLVTLLVLLGIVAVGGLGFAGYVFYKRRTSAPTGFVYIMLEGYS